MFKKFQNLTQSSKSVFIGVLVGLYLISAGISWAAFSLTGKDVNLSGTSNIGSSRSKLNLNLPKTEACPINGEKFTTAEKNIWEARRPITAMVENHLDSRPLEGISKADFVYEAVAEGGITRFLAVFYCGVAFEDVKVAPVRSARIYLIRTAREYGDKPLYVHVGGANNFCPNCYAGVKEPGTVAREVRALEYLESIGWRAPGGNDFDTTYDSGYPAFYRNPERLGRPIATEHTMTVSTDEIYKEAERRGLAAKDKSGKSWNSSFTSYKFVDEAKKSSVEASNISFKFWSNKPDYDVEWKYDSANNRYLRFNGGKEFIDMEFDNTQISAKNIIIQYVVEKGPLDAEGHMNYLNVGTGEAVVFQNGAVIKGSWSKATDSDRTKFFDQNKKEISLVRGVTWVELVPTGSTVEYN